VEGHNISKGYACLLVGWWVGGGQSRKKLHPKLSKGLGPKTFVKNMFIYLPLEITIISLFS
jgi:hypothetical protein